MKMDMGMRVAKAAKEITPDQMAELFAIRLANFHESQCPTALVHWLRGTPSAVLRDAGMIHSEIVRGWPFGWRRARITEFGERVLLSVAERAMVAQGRMKSLDPPEWSEAA